MNQFCKSLPTVTTAARAEPDSGLHPAPLWVIGSLTIVQTWYRDITFRALLLLSYRVTPEGGSLHVGHIFRSSKISFLLHKLKKRHEKLDKRFKPHRIYANMVSGVFMARLMHLEMWLLQSCRIHSSPRLKLV